MTGFVDLHAHILPGLDDGARDISVAMEMARLAVAEGISYQACTPHIMPGVYDNLGPGIRRSVVELQAMLEQAGIALRLFTGADVHVAPDLGDKIRTGAALTLNDSRYLLVEPPHHIIPPRLDDMFFNLLSAGYIPILTHPERMGWIEAKYPVIKSLAAGGVWMQVTAGALTGGFGSRVRYWAERMLDEGLVHIVATDAHDARRRPPRMRAVFDVLAKRIGEEEALNLLRERPLSILRDDAPDSIPSPPAAVASTPPGRVRRFVDAMFGKARS